MLFITINGQKESVDNFCGNNLPQQIMSNGPSMTVEFQSLYNLDQSKGFHATYSFITSKLIIKLRKIKIDELFWVLKLSAV